MKRVWLFLGLLVVMIALGVVVTTPTQNRESATAAAPASPTS